MFIPQDLQADFDCYHFYHILEINIVYITFMIKRASEDYIKINGLVQCASPFFIPFLYGEWKWTTPCCKFNAYVLSCQLFFNHFHLWKRTVPFVTFGWVSTISETHTLSRVVTCTRGMPVCFNLSLSSSDLKMTILIPVLNSIPSHWCAGCTMCPLPLSPFPIWCIGPSLPSTNIWIFNTCCIMQQI